MSSYDGKVTIWIKKNDRDKWKSIEKKSEFISEALNAEPIKMAYNPDKKEFLGKPVGDLLTTISGIKRASELKLCKKHGTPLTDQGKCLQKGH